MEGLTEQVAEGATDRPGAVFTIAPDRSFLDALARGILSRAPTPESLAAATVLLPTRRACRALADAFLRLSGGRPTVLPRLLPLGDVDGDEIAFAETDEASAETLGGVDALDIPPAIQPVRRLLLLASLISAHATGGLGDDQAVRLAAELARLIDLAATERRPLSGLAGLVPDEFASHWQITLDFLRVLTEHWPRILENEGAVDPAVRRNLLLDARARLWRAHPPEDPVIAAGTTGSVPATAQLLSVIARLPKGVVVLPGLDRALTAEALATLGPTHPQFGMARLLKSLNVEPSAVTDWPEGAAPPCTPETRDQEGDQAARARSRIIAAALDPPEAPPRADMSATVATAAFARVKRVDCPGPADEALVIALMLREALEIPGRTAALVTPDRALARRVAAELGRFGIAIDDSAGVPLAHTPPGAFLRLTARLAAERWAPVALLAALKHPLAAGGLAPARFRADVRALERLGLRGPRPGPGADGLVAALAAAADPNTDALARARRAVAAVQAAVAPFEALLDGRDAPLPELARAHIAFAEALASTDTDAGARRLWAHDAGENAAKALAAIIEGSAGLRAVAGHAYPGILDTLLSGAMVRPRFGRHPRLHIWGPLEARLQRADRIVLGGLNERTWPPEAQASPWMSRPMMERFGLSLPERRIGLAAHDFTQAIGTPEVFLTRAVRAEGSPTVPARWLRRLDTLLEQLGAPDALESQRTWLDWAAGLDQPAAGDKSESAPPEPRPPVRLRPRRLSVTRIETLIRDPYAVYARHVLRLKPLDPIDADPGAAERGIAIHKCLERFVRRYPDDIPADALDELVRIGHAVFAEHVPQPAVRALWWPRFLRGATWFVDYERKRRAQKLFPLKVEATGALTFEAPAGPFTLTAKADRIDRAGDGLAILDYKTGAAPTKKQVASGLAPQLTLEAAMAEAGAFEGIVKATVRELLYVQVSGGRVPGEEKVIDLGDLPAAIARARACLERIVAHYDDAGTPYLSRLRVPFLRAVGDYDHLARVREWSSGTGEDDA